MMAGALMGLATLVRIDRLIVLVPATVMIGFCNGLAIVIGLAQLHPFHEGDGWVQGAELGWMLCIAISSMVIMEYFPKIPHPIAKLLPSSLLSIVSALIIEWAIVRNT